MFGTLRVSQGSLSADSRQWYHGHFCSLCHSLDQWGGKLNALLTNYDMTFWLLVLAALDPPAPLARRPCTALPFRRVTVLELRPESRRLVAALSLALAGAKVEDDRLDGDRAWTRWAFLPLQPAWKRARLYLAQIGFPVDAVDGLGQWQRSLEQSGQGLPAVLAPTQELLAQVFGFLAEHCGPQRRRPQLEALGRALGTFIYLWDAQDDLERDRARGAYNALLHSGLQSGELAYRLRHSLAHLQQALQGLEVGERPQAPILTAHLDRLRSLVRVRWPQPPAATGAGYGPCWVTAAALSCTPRAGVQCCGGDDGGGSTDCDCNCCSCCGNEVGCCECGHERSCCGCCSPAHCKFGDCRCCCCPGDCVVCCDSRPGPENVSCCGSTEDDLPELGEETSTQERPAAAAKPNWGWRRGRKARTTQPLPPAETDGPTEQPETPADPDAAVVDWNQVKPEEL